MKKSISINLGTSNSVIAFKDTAEWIIRNNEEILVERRLKRDPILS